MNKIRFILFIFSTLFCGSQMYAQLYGSSAFLQGCYIELAVSDCGVYGSDDPVPASGPFGPYHDNVFLGLGFVADQEKDGWGVSTAPGQPDFCGDYFTPGSPEEGWAMQYGATVWNNHYVPCAGGGSFDMPGSVTGYTDTGGYKSATWEGSITSLDVSITQKTIFPDGALFFLTSVELCNDGATDLTDVYYMRNVDPDQDEPVCGTFSTHNYIVDQPPTSDTALVAAIGNNCGCYLGMGTIDNRARVSTGLFFTTDGTPAQSYAGTGGYMSSTPVGGYDCDCAIQITFKVDIPAGGCTTINYAHILNEADLPQALEATLLGGIGILADSVEIDSTATVEICKGDTVRLDILYGDEYSWTWSPSTTLSSDTGVTVFAFPDTTTQYTVTGVGECAELLRQFTIKVRDFQGANAGPDTIVCPEDTINLQGSGGVTYQWEPPSYLEEPTNPNTGVDNIPTDMYYFLYAYDDLGCADTDMVYIDLLPRPDVDAGPDRVIYKGGFTQLLASGATSYIWNPADYLSNIYINDPIANPPDTTVYFVTGTDNYGCINWDSTTVYVLDPVYIMSPNAFTPNGDNLNDMYIPLLKGPGELLDFQIFDRWGTLIYTWDHISRGWDGTYLGKPQEVGTYIVIIKAKDLLKNIEIDKTGSVILMR